MTPIEHAKRAYNNEAREYLGRPLEAAITAFLDAVLADPKAMEGLEEWICGTLVQARNAIEALKQEARR